MTRKNLQIVNKLGLHARAAAKFVELASGFSSHIELAKGERTVNGKSIMGIMMLAAACGTTVTLSADGEDEADAIRQITALINNRFGEDD